MPQMDPRALKATSVKAEDEHANSAEPQALKITAASSNPKMFTLPWHKPLATWPKDLLANLPRGISRHVVRFVHVGDEVYAMKEITRQVAEREYEILRRLQKLELRPSSRLPWSPVVMTATVSRWKRFWSPVT